MKHNSNIFFLIVFAISSCVPSSLQTQPPIPTSTKDWNILTSAEKILLDFALSPDGTQLAIYTNQTVYLYEIETSKEIPIEKFTDNSYQRLKPGAITFTVDGKRVAISGKFENQSVNIWDIKNKKWNSSIYKPENLKLITELEFNPDGNRLLIRTTSTFFNQCEGAEDSLTLVDFNNEATKSLFTTNGCMMAPSSYRFTDDEKLVIFNGTMSPDYSIDFVNSTTGEILIHKLYNSNENGVFYDIAYDGKTSAIYDTKKNVLSLTNLTTNATVNTFQGNIYIKLLRDEKDFLIYEKTTEKWSFWENGKQKCIYDGLQYTDITMGSKTSSNGEFLAIFTNDKKLEVWDIPRCMLIKEILFSE